MKSFIAIASLAFAACVSAQGAVDPAKLPKGWCMMYTEAACAESIVPTACGANSTYTTDCTSTFSMDKVCTSFQVSCVCTPAAGGERKDVSLEAFNKTFELMPYNMCGNLAANKNSTGPGLVSGDYKPDGKRPNATTTPSGSSPAAPGATTDGSTAGGKSGATSVQMAFSTIALAAISLGMAMVTL
ncbi:hypothetical protein BGX28_001044 [Mortierella sp. GBA30]|nr:hypothetical protein BGX28_001044 [Mortierella sp. GBA30]